jgi:hypothetical protein
LDAVVAPEVPAGQSRLVEPKCKLPCWLASQARPELGPLLQVPLRTPSLAVVSPLHRGHASAVCGELWIANGVIVVVRGIHAERLPSDGFTYPVGLPAT